MSETPSPSDANVQTTPANSATLFSAKLNFSAVLVTATIVFALVKLSAFLPQSYYFTLTSLVGGDRASPFIINTPFLLTNDELCERAAAKKITIERLCWDDEDDDDNKSPAVPQKPKDSAPPANPKPMDGGSNPNAGTSPSASPSGTELRPGNVAAPLIGTSPAAPSPPTKTEDEKRIETAQRALEQYRKERKESTQIKALQSDAPQGKSIIALLLRCLIPIFAGGIVAAIYRADLAAEAAIGAALAVAALFWPVAYLWQDLQIGDEWSDKQNLFMILYFSYAALFYFLAKLGSQLGFAYLGIRRGQAASLDYKRMIESFIPGLIAGVCVQLFVILLLHK